LTLRPWSRVQLRQSMCEVAPPSAGQIDPARSSRPLATPCRGKALRVSRGVGFRTPALVLPSATLGQFASAELVWSDDACPLQQAASMAAVARGNSILISIVTLEVPPSPTPTGVTFRWPDVSSISANRPRTLPSAKQPLAVEWAATPFPSTTPWAGVTPAHMGASSRLKHVRQPAASIADGRHIAIAPFGNSEDFIGKERQNR
jgi:hypothetical protein